MADETVLVRSMSRTYSWMAVLAFIILSASAFGQGPYSVNVSSSKFLGQFLVNESGYTLYYTSEDADGTGRSTCYNECAMTWPPFYAGPSSNLTLPEGLRPVDFGVIDREDGSLQTTYRGWPLYLYARDSGPGDTFGEGVRGVWHVVDPANQPQRF
ncbi:MAG: hypothetical protein QUS08_03635 [Methanothrix sp.]|nr:hypothetical protein [Methanothrix sp.]